MGAWGTGLLDNDVAMDATLSYDDEIDGGGSVDEAVAAAIKESEDLIDDEDDRADLILALAWIASEHQPPPAWLASEAREIVARGVGYGRWDAGERAERQAAERLLVAVLDGTASHPGRPELL